MCVANQVFHFNHIHDVCYHPVLPDIIRCLLRPGWMVANTAYIMHAQRSFLHQFPTAQVCFLKVHY